MSELSISVLRVVLCAVIALVCMMGSFYLSVHNIAVAKEVYAIAGLALAGVAGADIVSKYAIYKNGKG